MSGDWVEALRVVLTSEPGAYWGAGLWALAVLWLVFRFVARRDARRGGRDGKG